jgi:nucleoside-diphosphate-sugar epimerase
LFCATPCELAKAGTFAWFDEGVGPCNYVQVRNLVDAALLAAAKSEAHGEDFLIVDGLASWREFLTPLVRPWLDRIPSVASTTGGPSRGLERNGSMKEVFKAALLSPHLMAALARHPILGRLKDQFTTMLPRWHRQVQGLRPASDVIRRPASPIPATAMWLADIFSDVGPELSSSKARRILGWKPLVPLAEGQEECLAWLRDVVGLMPNEPSSSPCNHEQCL